ncbi:MAG: hypothetical protein QOI78_820 [Actinomycetota bacterium]|nr:hypothetical protein [Actinomycetota bacterium]
MQNDQLLIEIDGAEVPGIHCDLLSLEVELDEQLTGMFRMTLALLLRADGSWTYLDDERFAVWRQVVITAGLKDDSRRLLTGFITHVRPEFGPGMEQCRLAIWGMDASVLMDRADELKDWPNMRDSDIASALFTKAGLIPRVSDTSVVHDVAVSTIVQRETDIQLLKRLAARNGFECFVDGDAGYFRPPALDAPTQPELRVHAGRRTNVTRFCLEVDALAPAEVDMAGIDHTTGKVLNTAVNGDHQPAFGANRPASLLAPKVPAGRVVIGQTVATGEPEMAALCQALHDEGEWFVTGEGEVTANQYGSVLLPRSTVVINGIGETHSGTYYITHVTHKFSEDGYVQFFRVKRNALVSAGTGLAGAAGLR